MRALASPFARRICGAVEPADRVDPPHRQHRRPVHALRTVPEDGPKLANTRLLTVVGKGNRPGYGHTMFLNPSTCARDYLVSHLETGSLPPDGTVCEQDFVAFS
jgi:hypothetical protein